MTLTPETRYMSIEQCATYIGRTVQAVRSLKKRGQIPFNKVGARLSFDRERIDAWMGRHAHRGTMV